MRVKKSIKCATGSTQEMLEAFRSRIDELEGRDIEMSQVNSGCHESKEIEGIEDIMEDDEFETCEELITL